MASWKSAVLRAWLGLIPNWFSRWVSWVVLIGRPGWLPGKSHGDGARAEVGVDEHGLAVLVGLHAVPGQASDLVGASAGIDEDLGGGARVVAAVPDLVEGVQPLAELAEDLLGQGSAGSFLDDDRGHVVPAPAELPDGDDWFRGCPDCHLPHQGGGAGLAAHLRTVHTHAGDPRRPITIHLDL
ncbi:hypothetical protein [Streptomyces sp. NPDC058291]|uniref:hypothetical protein n=1 Tax=Streptomyces sp. NPDC058291 TaxID=3346427 RepID=UPI0036E14797